MAMLVLLARTARARVVATDFGAFALHHFVFDLRHRNVAQLRRGQRTHWSTAAGGLHLLLQTRGQALLFGFHRGDFFFAANADACEHLNYLGLDAIEHAREQLVRLALELLLGLLLCVTTQIDALTQVIHARQVFLPGVVHHAQHDVLFQLAHGFGTDLLLLVLEQLVDTLANMFEQRVVVGLALLLKPVTHIGMYTELALQFPVERLDIPLLVDAVRRHVTPHQPVDHVFTNIVDGCRHVFGLEQLVALRVDHLALIVGNVIEFQKVFTNIEVVLLDLALCLLDLPADHAIFQRVVFLHAEHAHPAADPVASEDAQQVVLQRQVETRRTRIALAARTTTQLVVDTARLMSLGTDNVQAAGFEHLIMALLPFGLGALAIDLVGIFGQRSQCSFKAAAEHDIGTAASHVGGDGDRTRCTGLRHDVRLALVLLGIEHFVLDAFLAQQIRQQLGHLDRRGADQYRLTALVTVPDVLDHGSVLDLLAKEYHVRVVLADHRLVGGNHHHFQAVDLLEFVGFGIGRAGHASQLLVHAEQILERHRGQRLVLALNRHAFLRLNRLMQAVGPAATRERTAGELIDDHHLAVAHDVVDVTLIDRVGAQRGIQVMHDGQILGIVQAAIGLDHAGLAQQLVGVRHALFGQVHLLLLLVDPVIARTVFFFLTDHLRHALVHRQIQLRRGFSGTGNDQRRTRFVDQDRVDFVDDGVVEAALIALVFGQGHVVAQVVKAEFVVGAVGDIGGIGLMLVAMLHAWPDHAHAQAKEVVQLAHLRRVAASQVVVHGDNVNAFVFQRVQIHRQRTHQGLAFAGTHFGDTTRMQHHAADHLHIVMTHAEHALGALAHRGKGLRQDLVQRFARGDTLLEFVGLAAQRFVAELFELRLKRIDTRYGLGQLAQHTFVAATEKARQGTIEHRSSGSGDRNARQR